MGNLEDEAKQKIGNIRVSSRQWISAHPYFVGGIAMGCVLALLIVIVTRI